jgi:ubiquinone/menaquinone biosynthesis C-methylase UbiE
MQNSQFPALGNTGYYAPIPLLTLDTRWRLRDVNLATQVLMGRDIGGWQGEPAQAWLENVNGRLQGGEWIFRGGSPSGGQGESIRPHRGVMVAEGRYASQEFGSVGLRWTAFTRMDTSTGAFIGTALHGEILSIERGDCYRQALLERWSQQLLWEEYAVSYDRVLLEMPYYREVIERHLQALTADGIETVIDIAAGTGNLVQRLLAAGRHVTAVDGSRAMLNKLWSKFREQDGGRLHVVEQNAESLSRFRNQQFDGVSILLALFDMSEARTALDEARRILRPGGTLVVTEPKHCFQIQEILDFCESHLKQRGLFPSLAADLERVGNANRTLNPSTRANRSPLRAEVIYDILQTAGFQELSLTDSHFGNCATIRGVKPR